MAPSRSMSDLWFWHYGRVLPQSASPYWQTGRHLIQTLAPLTRLEIVAHTHTPTPPPLCPIVHWWITSHHTLLTPCRHRLFSFMEMQPAEIDEEKTEDNFPKAFGQLALTLLRSHSARHLVPLPRPLFFCALCFWRWARQIHYSICSMERSPFTSWLILDGSFTLSSSLTMPLM